MARDVARWGPFKTARRGFIVSGVYALMGVVPIVFTVLWHGSGVYALLGAGWLLVAALWLAATLARRRHEWNVR